jgi:hypothetical protein
MDILVLLPTQVFVLWSHICSWWGHCYDRLCTLTCYHLQVVFCPFKDIFLLNQFWILYTCRWDKPASIAATKSSATAQYKWHGPAGVFEFRSSLEHILTKARFTEPWNQSEASWPWKLKSKRLISIQDLRLSAVARGTWLGDLGVCL